MNSSIPGPGSQTEKVKVLIADDDVPTRMLLRAAISQWNYEVVEASDGEEAWNLLQAPDSPCLLILDWLMPKLDGVSLAERIKYRPGLDHTTFIILLTQLTGAPNVTRALEAGADEFLSKPFNMAELRSRLTVGARVVVNERNLNSIRVACGKYAALLAELGTGIENVAHHLQEDAMDGKNSTVSDSIDTLNALVKKIRTFTQ